jgi:hypothetical protein
MKKPFLGEYSMPYHGKLECVVANIVLYSYYFGRIWIKNGSDTVIRALARLPQGKSVGPLFQRRDMREPLIFGQRDFR